MIVVDTNVVSEFMRAEPDPTVLDWALGFDAGELSITAITVQEIEFGVRRLPAGRRRSALLKAWGSTLEAFAGSVLTYDEPAARAAAQVLVEVNAVGRPVSLADAQIAGICVAGGHQLATRNVSDFEAVADLVVVNPFG